MDPRNVNGLVEADAAVIIATFEQLITEVGRTTTLDVKDELRNNDFWVDQKLVSDTLKEFEAKSDDYEYFVASAGYRVYQEATKPNPATAMYPPVPKAQRAKQPVGDWECRCNGDSETYCNMTRNQAKYLFSQQFGYPYTDVRSKAA